MSSTVATPVSVRSCCFNRITDSGSFINNRNLFLIDLEAEKSKIKVPVGSMSGGGLS